MALTAAQLEASKRWLAQELFVKPKVSADLSTSDIAAAAAAVDTWMDANVVSFLDALPEPFKANTDGNEKTLLFAAVALARRGLI